MHLVYHELPPSPALRALVGCYWSLRCAPEMPQPETQLLIPDGCVDIVFTLRGGEPSHVGAWVVGPMTHHGLAQLQLDTQLFAVRFRPGGATALLRESLGALTDHGAALRDLVPNADDVAMRLNQCRSDDQRVEVIEEWLRLRLRTQAPEPRVAHALEGLRAQQSIAAVAAATGMTRQHLGRLFRAELGLSPKLMGRVLRLQRALQVARYGEAPNWAHVAAVCGYADHAHMIREFKDLTGMGPREFLLYQVPFVQYGSTFTG